MRTNWKRTVLGVLLAGAVGGAAVGLAQPGDLPTFIPHTDPDPVPAVVPVQATEPVPRNDPAVALEWSGPAVVKVNQPTEYTLNVRNVCGQALQQVVVQVRAPKGTEIVGTTPAVKSVDGVYLWDLGTLDARTSKAVTVTLKQPSKGEMACQAWVTLTGTSAMKVAVKEPELAVTIKAPEKVVLGDKIAVEYTVTNTGDYPAENVGGYHVHDFGGCLAFNFRPGFDSIRLKPGESKTHKAEFTAGSPGPQKYKVMAGGADNLSALADATVQVLVPKLHVCVAGPVQGQIGTKGKYIVTVKNAGDVSLKGVTVNEAIPAGFKLVNPGDGKLAGDILTWAAGDLAPGVEKSFEFVGIAQATGAVTHRAEAFGDRNTKASSECVTTVEGIPGLRMELVDTADPVEKGGEITYEVKVTNTGTKADSEVRIVCELPKELEFVSCSGPTKGMFGTERFQETLVRLVSFDTISDLAPKTEAVFKVKVKGTGTGDVRFKAVMTSKHLSAPVTKEESTRVYGE